MSSRARAPPRTSTWGSGLPAPPGPPSWGFSQPDVISLISFPLSGGGEGDSFLFRGTFKASNGRLLAGLCSAEQFSVLIHSVSLQLPQSAPLAPFCPFLVSRLPRVCAFSKQPIFLMEAPAASCFLSLSSPAARREPLRHLSLLGDKNHRAVRPLDIQQPFSEAPWPLPEILPGGRGEGAGSKVRGCGQAARCPRDVGAQNRPFA